MDISGGGCWNENGRAQGVPFPCPAVANRSEHVFYGFWLHLPPIRTHSPLWINSLLSKDRLWQNSLQLAERRKGLLKLVSLVFLGRCWGPLGEIWGNPNPLLNPHTQHFFPSTSPLKPQGKMPPVQLGLGCASRPFPCRATIQAWLIRRSKMMAMLHLASFEVPRSCDFRFRRLREANGDDIAVHHLSRFSVYFVRPFCRVKSSVALMP